MVYVQNDNSVSGLCRACRVSEVIPRGTGGGGGLCEVSVIYFVSLCKTLIYFVIYFLYPRRIVIIMANRGEVTDV